MYIIYFSLTAYLVVFLKHFQQEAGNDTGDANEEVDDNQTDVRCTRLVKHKGRRVHHRCNRPAEHKKTTHKT